MLPIQSHTFKPVRWPFLIFIFTTFIYILNVLNEKVIERKDYAAIACAAFLFIYSILYVIRMKIFIDNDGIVDRKIFSETFISWNELSAVDIVTESHGHGLSFVWLLQRVGKKPYKMHLSYKSKNANIMAEAMVMRCKDAKLSNKIIKLAEGKRISVFLD
jgi:hypothetical protein